MGGGPKSAGQGKFNQKNHHHSSSSFFFLQKLQVFLDILQFRFFLYPVRPWVRPSSRPRGTRPIVPDPFLPMFCPFLHPKANRYCPAALWVGMKKLKSLSPCLGRFRVWTEIFALNTDSGQEQGRGPRRRSWPGFPLTVPSYSRCSS